MKVAQFVFRGKTMTGVIQFSPISSGIFDLFRWHIFAQRAEQCETSSLIGCIVFRVSGMG